MLQGYCKRVVHSVHVKGLGFSQNHDIKCRKVSYKPLYCDLLDKEPGFMEDYYTDKKRNWKSILEVLTGGKK